MSQLTETEPETIAIPKHMRSGRGLWGSLPVIPRRIALLVLFLACWQLYIAIFSPNPLLISGPWEVLQTIVEGMADGSLFNATLTTLRILLTAMVIGIVVAACLTTFATWTKLGDDILVLITSMLNPLPAIAVLPLAILWFGLNTISLTIVIANAVIWPIALNISMGFKTVNPTLLSVGQNMGMRGWRMVRNVLIPAALPHTLTGLKTGWAFGWRTIIAAELVFGVAGGGGGLGFYINDARYFLRTPEIFAGLVTIAIIGILLDAVFSWIERRTVIRWGMKSAN